MVSGRSPWPMAAASACSSPRYRTAVRSIKSRTDAIVVLTGGRQRLSTGLKLQAQGLAKQVFISGVNPDVEPEELAGFGPVGKAQIDCCVILGYAAANTLGNAAETAAWAKATGCAPSGWSPPPITCRAACSN